MVMLGAPSPLLIFAGLSLLAAALVWLLPESVGVTLSDVPDGGDELLKGHASGGNNIGAKELALSKCDSDLDSSSEPPTPKGAGGGAAPEAVSCRLTPVSSRNALDF